MTDQEVQKQEETEKAEMNAYYEKKLASSRITSIEMRKLIFEALAIEDPEKTPRKSTFKQYGYRGCVNDLRTIVESLAIERGLIEKVCEVRMSAWACPGEILYFMTNTNFNDEEDNLFNEEFHGLVYQNIISPGATGNMGNELPYFHVTKYGLSCIAEQEVLPYDPDGYLNKIRASGADDWDEFYIKEALTCFNAGAYSSAVIMLGLLGEYLATRLVEQLELFLQKNEGTMVASYTGAMNPRDPISQKYQVYEQYIDQLAKKKDSATSTRVYPDLFNLKSLLDDPAKATYSTFVRLTRNDLAHPSRARIERIECLMLFVTFTKYFDIQKKYLTYLKANS